MLRRLRHRAMAPVFRSDATACQGGAWSFVLVSPAQAQAGTIFSSSATWGAGGSLTFYVDDATGTEGVNWSKNVITNALTITATAEDPFTIEVLSVLPGTATPGPLTNFQANQNYSWRFVEAGSISGYDGGKFLIDAASFYAENPGATGVFSLSQNGGDLFLGYNVIPEPATLALLLFPLFVGCKAVLSMNTEKSR